MTLTEAQAHLADAETQLAAARKSAGYAIGSRSKTNQNITELQNQVDHWGRVVNTLTDQASGNNRGGGVRTVSFS